MELLKVDNQKIKTIKIKNGTLSCIGEVFAIQGDFEIELKDIESEDKNETRGN